MMCDTKMQETQYQVKDKALSTSISEDAATQTPRSVSESVGGFSVTPRSHAKSDATESDDESKTAPLDDESAYKAFLRELAGSFEQTGEDDDSEFSSEDGDSEDEEEESPSLFQKGSEGGQSEAPTAIVRRIGDHRGPTQASLESRQTRQHATPKKLSGSARGGSVDSVLSTASGGESIESDNDLIQQGDFFLTPRHDNRGPVEDDYDVFQALQDFAQGRPGSWLEQRREDLRTCIELKEAQAQSLMGPANNPHLSPEVRAHYARVRADLDSRREALELELAALDKEATLSSGDDSGSQAYEAKYLEATEAQGQCRFPTLEDGPAVVRAY